jgi:hypothetical protein
MENITVEWSKDRNNVIVVTYYTNDWQWSDLDQAFNKQRALLDESKNLQVQILVDVTRIQLVPKGGSLLSAARNLSRDAHPKQDHTIIIGARGIIPTILDMTIRLLGTHRSKIHAVLTFEDAYKIIDRLDADLCEPQA